MSDRTGEYTLTEFCSVTRLDAATVREMVSMGIIEPGELDQEWYFGTADISRCLKVYRLISELEVNMHGAALALDLMDRNVRLKRRVAYLEHLLDRFI